MAVSVRIGKPRFDQPLATIRPSTIDNLTSSYHLDAAWVTGKLEYSETLAASASGSDWQSDVRALAHWRSDLLTAADQPAGAQTGLLLKTLRASTYLSDTRTVLYLWATSNPERFAALVKAPIAQHMLGLKNTDDIARRALELVVQQREVAETLKRISQEPPRAPLRRWLRENARRSAAGIDPGGFGPTIAGRGSGEDRGQGVIITPVGTDVGLCDVGPASPQPRWALRHRVVGIVVGSVLLVAAVLKGYALATGPIAGSRWLDNRHLLIAVVELEWMSGVWLLSGLAPRWAWRMSIVWFCVFLLVSFNEAISGAASCGCFGHIAVHPWWTFGLDVGVLMSLGCGRPRPIQGMGQNSGAWRSCLIAFAVGIGGFGGWEMASYSAPVLDPDKHGNGVVANGSLVVLEPEKWVGQLFPLANNIDIGKKLLSGTWTLILYHADCGVCQQAVPTYRDLARMSGKQHQLMQFAFIEMPPFESEQRRPGPSGIGTDGTLDESHEWFATTPVVLRLIDGRVSAEFEGESYIKDPLLLGLGNAGIEYTH